MQQWRVREPFCGLSHLAGAGFSVAGLGALVSVSWGKPWQIGALSIYGASLIILYLASTLYHSLPVEPHQVERLRAVDQAAIYGLIAGTYTPLCVLSLHGTLGWTLLGVVWTVAVTAAVARLAWRAFPEWLSVGLYLTMGCLFVVALVPLFRALSAGGVGWLLFGGVFYVVGLVVLALDRPRLWPGRFGSHDLWHLFVLAGSACHFVMIRCFVAVA